MKNLAVLSLLMMAGCATTGDNHHDSSFDLKKVYCPKDTIEYCEGPNKKMLTCTCVERSSLRLPGLIYF